MLHASFSSLHVVRVSWLQEKRKSMGRVHTSIEESVPQSGELGSDIATSRTAGDALDDLRSGHCDDSSSTSIEVFCWMIIVWFVDW